VALEGEAAPRITPFKSPKPIPTSRNTTPKPMATNGAIPESPNAYPLLAF